MGQIRINVSTFQGCIIFVVMICKKKLQVQLRDQVMNNCPFVQKKTDHVAGDSSNVATTTTTTGASTNKNAESAV